MPEVTYTGGGHYRVGGYGFDPGTTHDVDDEVASYLADHDDFTVDEDTTEDVVESGASGTLPFNPENQTNAEIEDRVQDIDDTETLRALRNLEEDQKNRDGATDAITDRLNELED